MEETGESERMCYPLEDQRPDPRSLTCADARVANSNGATQEAGGLAQVTRGDVGNVVVATEFLAGAGRHRAGGRTTHHTVSAAGLVHKARLGAWAHYVSAGLCGPERGRVRSWMKFPLNESSYP